MCKGRYYTYTGLQVSVGNVKLGTDTMIFNMAAYQDCPSKRLGLCKIGKKCYARKAEYMYKNTLPYRRKQQKYWLETSVYQIYLDFVNMLTQKKRNGKPLHESIKYFRFNESGDFHSQECIDKLDTIAKGLMDDFSIRTYGHSARSDLDFSGLYFSVKGSGHLAGNNGITIARDKKLLQGRITYSECYIGYQRCFTVCQMDCTKCNYCKEANGLNIVFPLH